MTVNTTGIRTTVDCSAPQSIALDLTTTTNFTIRATNQDNCPVTVFFNPQSAVQQYGVSNVPCSTTASLNITFQPVFFWFFHENLRNNTPEATGVFCHPFIEMFWLKAHADIASGKLLGVEPMTEITAENFPNNVTMAPQNQLAFNGFVFFCCSGCVLTLMCCCFFLIVLYSILIRMISSMLVRLLHGQVSPALCSYPYKGIELSNRHSIVQTYFCPQLRRFT